MTRTKMTTQIWSKGWSQHDWDLKDIPGHSSGDFMTTSTLEHGSFAVSHRPSRPMHSERLVLRKASIIECNLTDLCLETDYWAFGSEEDLDVVRLRMWRSLTAREAEEDSA